MKKVTEEHFCDRCGGVLVREGEIIELLSYTHSGYSRQGDGGITVKNLEFCNKCSSDFLLWKNNPNITPPSN